MPIRNCTRKGPSPGFYILGALGSCPVMGIKFMAAQRGIEVRALSIDTEADWDPHPRQLCSPQTPEGDRLAFPSSPRHLPLHAD
ncbi:OsmC family protein [Mesorhizobium temperatum]|uniref:Uncharacterized protein n=1 Tax=Mesorhizobium temperatum TaxID=241416 RepID=A0A271LNS6_9HYPH|nr:hypothetical protein CIT26_11085 [Mesorhizobium temperatum]